MLLPPKQKPLIVTGMCQCSFGLAPSPFMIPPMMERPLIRIPPTPTEPTPYLPGGTIMDHIPFLNILPFGMCMSLMNPTVMMATIASLGILTPMPCIPITLVPWIPMKPLCQSKKIPMLLEQSMTICMWGGIIRITMPGISLITI